MADARAHVPTEDIGAEEALGSPSWLRRSIQSICQRPWLLFASVLLIYLSTATYTVVSIDVVAAEFPAWSVASGGGLNLSGKPTPDVPWFFEHEGGIYSDRFPGAIAYLVPYYWVAHQLGLAGFSLLPGAIAAATVSAAGVLVLGRVYRLTLASPWHADVATVFTAFGTGVWSVCANAPWSHTLNLLLIALGLWALAAASPLWAGLAFGLVVLTRPHWAVALLLVAVSLGWAQRSVVPAMKLSLGMIPGVAALVAYNGVLFGRWGPSNGHELGGSVTPQLADFPVNALGAIWSPTRGLVFFYPVVLLAAVGFIGAWRTSEPWQRAAFVGGAAGIGAQLLLNRYSGGDTFFGPRLWVEPLVLAAPLLALAVVDFARARPGSSLVPAMLWVGVGLHGLGAIVTPY